MTEAVAAGALDTQQPSAPPAPIPSTKANAVFALGLIALVTGPLLGGVIPALLAFPMARQARLDLTDARGYLTGARRIRQGEMLAIVGLTLSLVVFVVGIAVVLVGIANGTLAHDFADTMQ